MAGTVPMRLSWVMLRCGSQTFWNRIVSKPARERLAAQQALQSQPRSAPYAETLDRFIRVSGTCRLEPAAPCKQKRKVRFVDAKGCQRHAHCHRICLRSFHFVSVGETSVGLFPHPLLFGCASIARITHSSPSRAPQQPQQLLAQHRKSRARHAAFRMNHDVPSRGYLLAMAAHDFSNSAPDAIAHHRPAKRFLDAEPKAAVRQLVGAKENSEVRAGTALSRAVDTVEFAAPHEPRLARKIQPPRAIRA